MRIVVADDSRVMRQIVIRAMRQAGHTGHTFLEAADGDAAFELVRAEAPGLVLSDWNMPGTSGLDLLRRLRASGNTVTFGFVTSESSPDMRRRAYDAGAQFLIGKPFAADDFREVLGPESSTEEAPATVTSLPSARAVRNLLETLLGRDVAVTPAAPVEVGPLDPAHVAVYVDDRTRMVATAVADLPLAVHCGAALGLTPRRVADEAVRSRRLPALLRRGRRRGAQRRLHPVQPRRCAARAAALDVRPRRAAPGRRGRRGAHGRPPPGPARRRGGVRRRAAGPGAGALTRRPTV